MFVLRHPRLPRLLPARDRRLLRVVLRAHQRAPLHRHDPMGRGWAVPWPGTVRDVGRQPRIRGECMIVLEQPMLPYAGSSGWSGSDTSEERAARKDFDGSTKRQQNEVLRILDAFGGYGVTWKELAGMTGWHHGTASGNLSTLHKAGLIARLATTRQRCKVYVTPEYAADRPTEPHGSHKAKPRQVVEADHLDRITETVAGACWPHYTNKFWCDRHNAYATSSRGCTRFQRQRRTVAKVLREVGIEVHE